VVDRFHFQIQIGRPYWGAYLLPAFGYSCKWPRSSDLFVRNDPYFSDCEGSGSVDYGNLFLLAYPLSLEIRFARILTHCWRPVRESSWFWIFRQPSMIRDKSAKLCILREVLIKHVVPKQDPHQNLAARLLTMWECSVCSSLLWSNLWLSPPLGIALGSPKMRLLCVQVCHMSFSGFCILNQMGWSPIA
jgi:hypothetical protein